MSQIETISSEELVKKFDGNIDPVELDKEAELLKMGLHFTSIPLALVRLLALLIKRGVLQADDIELLKGDSRL